MKKKKKKKQITRKNQSIYKKPGPKREFGFPG